jgi:predicted RNA binding protein YcfA (HicA-like mRNA interferase family)
MQPGEHTLPISGKEMLRRYQKAGWRVVGRRGSHVKVGKQHLREIIPMHKELKKGLEQKLLKRLQSEEQ